MNRDALWRILGLSGVPTKLIDLMSELYSATESAVRCGGIISDLFPVVTGIHQGVCTGPYTFQYLYGLDSREDVGEIKPAVHRLGMSRSLTLISQIMQSSWRRL